MKLIPKCFHVLIDAFDLYTKDDKNAKLLIAGGDDGVRKQLLSQIKTLNLSDSVFLIGAIDFDDKKLILNNCDVFALASEFESFGIVVAEALACGLPVVASNKTPWHDIEKNNCGIFVNNKKTSFYQGFKKIIDKEYNKELIKEYVRLNYDLEVIVGRFINLIKK